MSISLDTLKEAIRIKEQITELEARLEKILGKSELHLQTATPTAKKGRRTLSAAARAKIAAGQRARWAKIKSK